MANTPSFTSSFLKTRFVLSAYTIEQLQSSLKTLPHTASKKQIAFIGRSNVGKSSLINHLTQQKNLAKISSKPGKTRSINFFSIDDQCYLVDLPGYGYAKTSAKEQEKWAQTIDAYLASKEPISLLLQLVDARHPPSAKDKQFFEWAYHYDLPLLIVCTKTDKVKPKELQKNLKTIRKTFTDISGKGVDLISYSIHDAKGRKALIAKIGDYLQKGEDEERVE